MYLDKIITSSFFLLIFSTISYSQAEFDLEKWKEDRLGRNGYRYSLLIDGENNVEIFDEDAVRGKSRDFIENRYGEADEICDLGSQLNLNYYLQGFERLSEQDLNTLRQSLSKCEKVDVKATTKITLIIDKQSNEVLSYAISQSGG
jgi:hypothetical protein